MLYLQVDMKATPAQDGTSWTVGELAERVGVATHVLRHWEDAGLLSPGRTASGYRRYTRDDLVRVLVIQTNKVAGMTLDQIRVLLDVDAQGRHAALESHLASLARQVHELERSRLMTEHALRCRAHDVAQCPRFVSYVADVVEGHAPPAVDGIPGWSLPAATGAVPGGGTQPHVERSSDAFRP
jgi:DNA-binding transcriptional MerR regulator